MMTICFMRTAIAQDDGSGWKGMRTAVAQYDGSFYEDYSKGHFYPMDEREMNGQSSGRVVPHRLVQNMKRRRQ
jgi:hypothetical protein